MAKRAKESMPESGIVKVVDPLYDAPLDAEEQRVLPPPPPAGSRFQQGARRFFELLLRLISWVIIFTVFGAALYYGVPLLYQRFVVPVEQNTTQVGELQARQQQLEQQVAALQQQLDTLETGQGENSQALSDLDERLNELETSIASHTKSLAALDEMQSELQKQDELTSAELERQIDLLKSMELLSRARLFMYQSNFGLAKADVQIARDLLIDVQPAPNTSLAHDRDAVIHRLDLVLSTLPSFPVAASDDLDIAWQILITGMPPVNTNATAIPADTLFSTPEPTSTPALQATPTP
jgi:cell division protein FtsB